MTTNDKPTEVEQIACDVCMKEVPLSQATVPESQDYVAHFCGLECYAKWKGEHEKTQPDSTPT